MSDDRELMTGLRRLADDAVVPPIDPAQEQRLLAAFDEHWSPRLARSRARSGQTRRAAAIGLLATAAGLVWVVAHRDRRVEPTPAPARAAIVTPPPAETVATEVAAPTAASRPARRPPRPRAVETAFVMLPGAGDLPRFESGQLMRMELPASVVVSLGLRPSRPLRGDGSGSLVQTDVLVGQDGYARAVRLVQ
ncbi:MAG TPA: hypothetical protein VKH42_19215 [Vicinamibacterales bacterium]|nr:hypothetical protein [Vicinamibacterales bacterium]